MDEKQKKEIEKLIGGMTCPKDFKCYKSGLKELCKSQEVGIGSFLRCMEEERAGCEFLVTLGSAHFCECPLRNYIVKKLKK